MMNNENVSTERGANLAKVQGRDSGLVIGGIAGGTTAALTSGAMAYGAGVTLLSGAALGPIIIAGAFSVGIVGAITGAGIFAGGIVGGAAAAKWCEDRGADQAEEGKSEAEIIRSAKNVGGVVGALTGGATGFGVGATAGTVAVPILLAKRAIDRGKTLEDAQEVLDKTVKVAQSFKGKTLNDLTKADMSNISDLFGDIDSLLGITDIGFSFGDDVEGGHNMCIML